jgi:hypothetical protein
VLWGAYSFHWNYIAQPDVQKYIDARVGETIVKQPQTTARDLEQVRAKLETESGAIRREIQILHSTDDLLLRQLRNRIEDEVDSTYYFSKAYSVSDHEKEQPPVEHFFYAQPHDRVSLFIWTSEAFPKLEIRVNNGTNLKPSDLGANNWSNVNLSPILKKYPISGDEYLGLPSDVHYIAVKPIPKALKPGTEFIVHALIIVRRGQTQ